MVVITMASEWTENTTQEQMIVGGEKTVLQFQIWTPKFFLLKIPPYRITKGDRTRGRKEKKRKTNRTRTHQMVDIICPQWQIDISAHVRCKLGAIQSWIPSMDSSHACSKIPVKMSIPMC